MKIKAIIAVTATTLWVAASGARAEPDETDTTTKTTTITTTEPVAPLPAAPAETTPAPVVNNTVIIPPEEDEPAMDHPSQEWAPRSGMGVSIMAGGGVQDFASDTIRDMTGTAGFWDVRAAVGTRSVLGFEAAYVGAAQNIDALGLDTNATLVSNGVEGDLRLHAPMTYQGGLLAPYVFGGVGWQHYSIVNSEFSTASLNNSDDVLTLPVGAGFTGGYRGFIADLRFTYRFTDNENLLEPMGGGGLDNWNVGANLGYEF